MRIKKANKKQRLRPSVNMTTMESQPACRAQKSQISLSLKPHKSSLIQSSVSNSKLAILRMTAQTRPKLGGESMRSMGQWFIIWAPLIIPIRELIEKPNNRFRKKEEITIVQKVPPMASITTSSFLLGGRSVGSFYRGKVKFIVVWLRGPRYFSDTKTNLLASSINKLSGFFSSGSFT